MTYPGSFDFNTLWTLAGLDLPELRDPPWTPRVPAALRSESLPLVNVIQRGDMLVHVPYESFDASVERFIREGTADPSTLGRQDDRLSGGRRHAVRRTGW